MEVNRFQFSGDLALFDAENSSQRLDAICGQNILALLRHLLRLCTPSGRVITARAASKLPLVFALRTSREMACLCHRMASTFTPRRIGTFLDLSCNSSQSIILL